MRVHKFQELYFIAGGKDAAEDKAIKMVGAITGLTPDRVEAMPLKRFNRVCAAINKQFEVVGRKMLKGKPMKLVRARGRWYRLNYDIERVMKAGQYVEQLVFNKDIIGNLHKIMASLATPLRWSWKDMRFIEIKRDHRDVARDMERMVFDHAYHSAVFFYTLYSASMQIIRPYLVRQMEEKGIRQEVAMDILTRSSSILDGFTMPGWSQNMRAYLLNRFGSLA